MIPRAESKIREEGLLSRRDAVARSMIDATASTRLKVASASDHQVRGCRFPSSNHFVCSSGLAESSKLTEATANPSAVRARDPQDTTRSANAAMTAAAMSPRMMAATAWLVGRMAGMLSVRTSPLLTPTESAIFDDDVIAWHEEHLDDVLTCAWCERAAALRVSMRCCGESALRCGPCHAAWCSQMKVCAGCDVVAECLAYAMRTEAEGSRMTSRICEAARRVTQVRDSSARSVQAFKQITHENLPLLTGGPYADGRIEGVSGPRSGQHGHLTKPGVRLAACPDLPDAGALGAQLHPPIACVEKSVPVEATADDTDPRGRIAIAASATRTRFELRRVFLMSSPWGVSNLLEQIAGAGTGEATSAALSGTTAGL